MGSIIAIIAIIFGATIPITAIISSTILKAKKLKLEAGSGITKEEKLMLQKALKENEMLKQRVENLEMVTSDPDVLKLNSSSEENLQQQINSLKKEILKLNSKSETT